MSHSSEIAHKGMVKEIRDNVVFVEIQVSSACGACKAAAFCGTSEGGRLVEAKIPHGMHLEIGEEVSVKITESMGTKALLLGYGLPFVVVVLAIFVLIALGVGEGISALVSLVALAIYYFVMYLCRDRIKKEFNFIIEK